MKTQQTLNTEKLDKITETNGPTAIEMAQKKDVTVSAIAHYDVYGKKLWYLRIEQTGQEAIMLNVGQKTYDKIQSLQSKP